MPKKPEKGRPPYFLCDPASWNGSRNLRDMSAAQVGWYIQLLMDAWLSTETPQATLPNNIPKLQKNSRYAKSWQDLQLLFSDVEYHLKLFLNVMFKEIDQSQVDKILGTVMDPLKARWYERLQQEWEGVIAQFKTTRLAQNDQEVLYNERQFHELKQWMDSYRQKVDAGSEGARKRWQSVELTDSEQLMSETLIQPHPSQNSGPIIEDSEPMAPLNVSMADPIGNNNSLNVYDSNSSTKIDKPNIQSKVVIVKTLDTVKKEDSTNTKQEEKEQKKSLLKKKPESLFEETRFSITVQMSEHLSVKYPKFVSGDWNYLVEKFKNVYHGKRYISWKRTFYNFVSNQVTHYGYYAGLYTKLESEAKSQPKGITLSPPQPICALCEAQKKDPTMRPCPFHSGSSSLEEDALPLGPGDIK